MKPARAAGLDQASVFRDVAARDEHDHATAAVGDEPQGDLESVHVGELDVQKHDLGLEPGDSLQQRAPSSASPTTSYPSVSSSCRAVARKLGWSSTMSTLGMPESWQRAGPSAIRLAVPFVRGRVGPRGGAHPRRGAISPGGAVTALVSGGADSTCLWHVLRELGYAVTALHVDHGLRGEESAEDARFCREVLGAEVVDGRGGATEEELREIRYSFARDPLRATGHTASDQVETVLFRLVSRGAASGSRRSAPTGSFGRSSELRRRRPRPTARRRPLVSDRHVEPGDEEGLIREQIVPLLQELHPAAERNLLALLDDRDPLHELLTGTNVTRRLDLGGGTTAVREYDSVWLERSPVALEGRGALGRVAHQRARERA